MDEMSLRLGHRASTKNEDRAEVGFGGRCDWSDSTRHQSASTAPAWHRMAELENSLGVSRGRSVETLPAVRRMPRAAVDQTAPTRFASKLAKGTQENEPQYPD